jgi:hypothetical protein
MITFSEFDQLQRFTQAQLFHNTSLIGTDGFVADMQFLRNLHQQFAPRDIAKNLQLPIRQAAQQVLLRLYPIRSA